MKKNLRDLLVEVNSLVDEDLVDRRVEARARTALEKLRKRRIEFQDYGSDDDCLSCLDLALTSASEILERKYIEIRRRELQRLYPDRSTAQLNQMAMDEIRAEINLEKLSAYLRQQQ